MSKKEATLIALQTEKTALRNTIQIKGARSNNLNNIDLDIPKNKLIVVTGVSGSGKSSLTMDTLYAEGQRRYVESLSSYARQFLGRMKKPDVDYIKGICPAIAIEQKVSTRNARSTVGTLTEIYDYLRLLFARIGKTYSPISGELVRRHSVSDVTDFINSAEEGQRVQLFIPMPAKYAERTLAVQLKLLLQKGYTRLVTDDKITQIEDFLENPTLDLSQTLGEIKKEEVLVLIDRFAVKKEDEENVKRIADSVNTAFYESEGECVVDILDGETAYFNNRFELDGMAFLDPTPQLFNFNNPYGACPKCQG
ncbi:MAG: excinuclease ABC subunit A, partial [Saprospiraceae bacterium]